MGKGKKIGKSVIGKKRSSAHIKPPTLEELNELKEQMREEKEEQEAERKDRQLEKSGATRLPNLPFVSDKTEKQYGTKLPVSPEEVQRAIKRDKEIEASEVKDKRLKKKKKTRIDIKEVES
jgi:hypothetical protein